MSEHTVIAAAYCEPEDGPVDSAARVADAVLDATREHERVLISMSDLRGASSSFFNVILDRIARELGPDAARQRVMFVDLGKHQVLVFERSRAAILGA